MNARLKESVAAAASSLPEDGQNVLADAVDLFASNYGRRVTDDFTSAELAEIERIAAEPFAAADPKAVEEFFSGNGVRS